jgi:hypothetical protein
VTFWINDGAKVECVYFSFCNEGGLIDYHLKETNFPSTIVDNFWLISEVVGVSCLAEWRNKYLQIFIVYSTHRFRTRMLDATLSTLNSHRSSSSSVLHCWRPTIWNCEQCLKVNAQHYDSGKKRTKEWDKNNEVMCKVLMPKHTRLENSKSLINKTDQEILL